MPTYLSVLQIVLKRAYEDPADAAGDFYTAAQDCLSEAWRWLIQAYPWLDLVKDPPGAFVTAAQITNLTVTAAAGASIAGTLSAAPAGGLSVAGYKLKPSAYTWAARITAHVAGDTAITLDAVPTALTAAACTIFKDEYALASDLGAFVDGLWADDGSFAELITEDDLKTVYGPNPTSAARSAHFARLTKTKIRLAQYPTGVVRYEYPYTYEATEPALGDTTLVIGNQLIPAWIEKGLSLLLGVKFDKREGAANTRAEQALEHAIAYETRRRLGLGKASNRVGAGPYAETRGYGS